MASLCRPTPFGITRQACPARVKTYDNHDTDTCQQNNDDNTCQQDTNDNDSASPDADRELPEEETPRRVQFGHADIEEYPLDNIDDMVSTTYNNAQKENVQKKGFIPKYDRRTMINHYQGRPAITDEAWAVFRALQLRRKGFNKQ